MEALDQIVDTHQLASREQLNRIDALIAEAEIRSRSSVVFSGDFSQVHRIHMMKVVNPFLTAAWFSRAFPTRYAHRMIRGLVDRINEQKPCLSATIHSAPTTNLAELRLVRMIL